MLFVLALSIAQAACPTFAEPDGEWGDRTEAAAEASDALAALESYAFPAVMDEEERTGVRTDGLVIVRDGEILYERYGRDWTADKTHLQWSATKSVAASLTGMAVQQELLDIDASICDSIEVGSPEACQVTARNLMEHASGFAWRETYEGQSPTASSVVGMLYGAGMQDMSRFVTAHPIRDTPGTAYSYSSGDSLVLTSVAHTLLKKAHGEDYLQELLYGPLGITSAQFEVDGTGLPIGGSTLYLTPRDMVRYGSFLLQDGCWNGTRLLPEGWVARATTPASSVDAKHIKPITGALPGWNLWLNQTHPNINGGRLPWPDTPEGTFAALGHWRQSIYVMPEQGVVVARTGDDRDGSYSHNTLLSLVTAFVEAVPPAEAVAVAAEPEADAGAPEETSTETESTPEAASADSTVADATEAADATDASEPEPEPITAPVRGFTPAAFPPPPLKPSGESTAVPPAKYDVSLLAIGTSYAALQGCTCRYISGRSEDACIDYIRITPDIARAKFDDETRTVTAKAFGLAKTRAQPGPDGTGCRLID